MKKTNAKKRKTDGQSRRDFLKRSSLAIGPFLMGSTLFSRALAASPSTAKHTLVFVFLRGGTDALSILAPISGPDRDAYDDLRPTINVPVNKLLPLLVPNLGPNKAEVPFIPSNLGLNKAALPLKTLYDDEKLSFFMNVGCLNTTTSHFGQQDNIEFGMGKTRDSSIRGGFLNRALSGIPDNERSPSIPALSLDKRLAKSLEGRETAVAFDTFDANKMSDDVPGKSAGLNLNERLNEMFIMSQASVLPVDSSLKKQGGRADLASKTITAANKLGPSSTPRLVLSDKADYSGINSFRNAVRIMKKEDGLRFLTITIPSWDDHAEIGSVDGNFANRLEKFSKALKTFVFDLEENDLINKTTIVVMSEFGRRVEENGSRGCDHGRGGIAMVIGADVKKQVNAPEFSLATGNLDEGNLPVKIDYRKIFAQILDKKMKLPNVYTEVFPPTDPDPENENITPETAIKAINGKSIKIFKR